MISHYRRNPSLTASQLAKNTYGSFATAWEVMKDVNLLGNAFQANLPMK
jgi:hypothetical protein